MLGHSSMTIPSVRHETDFVTSCLSYETVLPNTKPFFIFNTYPSSISFTTLANHPFSTNVDAMPNSCSCSRRSMNIH